MIEKIQPLSNRVFIMPDKQSEVQGGVYLLGEDRPKVHTGVILAIGKNVPVIKIGEKVIFAATGSTVVTINNVDVLVYRSKDVFAKKEGSTIIPLAL